MPLYMGNEQISRVAISFEGLDGRIDTQDATITSGNQMLQGVTAYGKNVKYTGTIPTKTSSDISVSGNIVTIPAGYYSTSNDKTVAATEVSAPSISVSSDGLITASNVQTTGYVIAETKNATYQLDTQGAKTVTPSSSAQTAVSAGKYITGDIIVSSVPTETKDITSNGIFTPSSGKFFSSVTVDIPSDAVSLQEKTITPTEDVQVINPDDGYGGFSSVTISAIPTEYIGSGVIVQKYYTGSTEPSSDLGNDGDLYLKV